MCELTIFRLPFRQTSAFVIFISPCGRTPREVSHILYLICHIKEIIVVEDISYISAEKIILVFRPKKE
jgi:hypothetical protein